MPNLLHNKIFGPMFSKAPVSDTPGALRLSSVSVSHISETAGSIPHAELQSPSAVDDIAAKIIEHQRAQMEKGQTIDVAEVSKAMFVPAEGDTGKKQPVPLSLDSYKSMLLGLHVVSS